MSCLRGVAVGRRNWLFAAPKTGGERAAAIHSVIETAKANGVEPQAWLTDVLARLGEGLAFSRIDGLMPLKWSERVAPSALAA